MKNPCPKLAKLHLSIENYFSVTSLPFKLSYRMPIYKFISSREKEHR